MNFVSIDIDSSLLNEEILAIFADELPDFDWRQGDSDAQGPYVSGSNDAQVDVQCWTGENPMGMSISFRSAQGVAQEARAAFLGAIQRNVLPRMGVVLKTNIKTD